MISSIYLLASILSLSRVSALDKNLPYYPNNGRIEKSSNFRRTVTVATPRDGKVANPDADEYVNRVRRLQDQYPDCKGSLTALSDAFCDEKNNNSACGWDGGDCCEESCTYEKGVNAYNCPSEFFDCKDPVFVRKAARSICEDTWSGDGFCDEKNNDASCGYDGGDCCKSTCQAGTDFSCDEVKDKFTFDCRDPNAKENKVGVLGRSFSPGEGRASSNEQQQWLNGHNTRRADFYNQHGVSNVPLVWSQELEANAQAYANKLTNEYCSDYDHDPTTAEGENLAVLWGEDDIDRVLTAWVENEYLSPSSPLERGHGHMTQALWRPSKYVGCATAFREGPMEGGRYNEQCYIYVCRYLTPGNCVIDSNNWLNDVLQEKSRCKPDCPPTEGCFAQS